MEMCGVNGELGKASAAEEAVINKIVDMKIADAKEKADENTVQANRTIIVTSCLATAVFFLSILIGFYISGSITKPLSRVVNMLEEMSKGHLKERLNVRSKDEIGRMAHTLDSFADELQINVVGIMDQISQGDVSAAIEVKDEFDEISPSLKRTLETVKKS